MTRKALGQHFLTNRNIGKKMVQLVQAGDRPILEIGAGKGVLSELLLESHPGTAITLVEIDRKLSGHLQEHLGNKCQLLNADILDLKLRRLFGQKRISLVGTIPYCISKPLIDWIIRESGHIENGVFMMQKAFVNKLIHSSDSKKNAQSMVFQLLYASKNIMDVRPGSFSPPPEVVSTIFTFKKNPLPAEIINIPDFYQFLKIGFASRRKTLINNLAPEWGLEKVQALFILCNLKASLRSEQLDLSDFIRLYSGIFKKKNSRFSGTGIFHQRIKKDR